MRIRRFHIFSGCMYAIHLKTMQGFKINFSHLNIPGGNSSCYLGAVSLHSLSNLIPSDNLEGYRLCSENSNVGNYFLTSNIATVIFYSNLEFPPNSTQSYGFSFHWEGLSFQPIPTIHSSTYSISPTGVIWYPFEGEYPANAGMTWLVKGVSSSDVGPTVVDIEVVFVDLENCNLGNKCLCDAVIIYEVSTTGGLKEIDRFCGDKNNGRFQNVNSIFIVAFYSDNSDSPQAGRGFQLVWRQGIQTTTEDYSTTTTEDYTTTSGPPIITTCGGIIEGNFGTVSFKNGEAYGKNERCIWTIRISPPHTEMTIKLLENGFVNYDYISVFSFVQQTGLINSMNLGKNSNSNQEILVVGSVAIIMFSSDSTMEGNGFLLEFTARGRLSSSINHFYDYQNNDIASGSLVYPPTGNYQNGELSTFIFTKVDGYSSNAKVGITVNSNGIETCGRSKRCACDGVLIYESDGDRLKQVSERICGNSTVSLETLHTFIIVFYSDASTNSPGFTIQWSHI